jgi:hypothetical protein
MMMTPVAHKALRLLCHPLSLAAIGLVLLNDFVLRPLAPSGWTGKLSDVGQLFFFPYLLSVLLALLAPGRLRRRASAIGGIAFAAVGAGFVLLKLSPTTNAWLLGTVHTLTGVSIRAVPDPTDLWALPALALSAWTWFRSPAPGAPANRVGFPIGLPRPPAHAWQTALFLDRKSVV